MVIYTHAYIEEQRGRVRRSRALVERQIERATQPQRIGGATQRAEQIAARIALGAHALTQRNDIQNQETEKRTMRRAKHIGELRKQERQGERLDKSI